tara:strand:- start:303 stop:1151 length:849 start_codon:yes stop_codon:yes gene_type:complete
LKAIKNVSIIFSSSRSIDKVLEEVKQVLSSSGAEILEIISIKDLEKKKKFDELSKSELILVIGGDGTMIGSIRNLYEFGIPFLGINLGKVGFLTDIQPNNLEALNDVLDGKFIYEERPIYKVNLGNNNEDIFVNEVVIHSGSVAKMINIELSVNSKNIYDLNADGIIVASSTGSTAYSYSGGGPVISPKIDALSFLPMFSHSTSSHCLVIENDQPVDIKVNSKSNITPDVVLDGKSKLKYGKGKLKVSNLKKSFLLYHPKDYNYFEACRNKLGLANPIEKIQ